MMVLMTDGGKGQLCNQWELFFILCKGLNLCKCKEFSEPLRCDRCKCCV